MSRISRGAGALPALLAGLLSSAAFGPLAWAQTSSDGPSQSIALEEVTVTARKMEERLIDAPVSLTAVTARDLEERNVQDMRQFIQFTPGFFFQATNAGRADRGIKQLAIRGIVPTGDLDSEQGASVFIDGAPMSGNVISGLEDAERVEILRGPQSAYFGRATFSGAINFVTKTPSNYFQGKVIGELAQWGTVNIGAQVEGPIIKDVLSARLSVSRNKTDGQYKAFNNGVKLGARESVNLAFTLYFEPTDRFDAKLRLAGWNDDDGPAASSAYGFGNGESRANCRVVGTATTLPVLNGTNNWFCGSIPNPTAAEIGGDFDITPRVAQLLANIPDPGFALQLPMKKAFIDQYGMARRARAASLIWNYRFNDWTFSSNTAYHHMNVQTLDDIDRRANVVLGGSPLTNAASLHTRHSEDFSQEFRLTSPQESRLRGMIGVSFFKLEYDQTTGFLLRDQVRSLGFGNLVDTRTYGLFGAIQYDILDNLTIALEARRQWDNVAKSSPDGTNRLEKTFKSVTPRVHIDYKITPDQLLFASYAVGVKPGTFNPAIASFSPEFIASLPPRNTLSVTVDEEKLKQAEIGYKASLWDRRVPQVNSGTGPVVLPNGTTGAFTLISNTGLIRLWGVEAEGTVRLTEELTLNGTFSWNDSKIVRQPCANCLNIFGGALEGRRYSATPEIQASAAATYRKLIAGDMYGFGRIEGSYTGRTNAFSENLLNIWWGPPLTRVNLRAGVETDRFRVEAYVTNLFKDDGPLGVQQVVDYAYFGVQPTRQMLSVALGEKRTVGIRGQYKF